MKRAQGIWLDKVKETAFVQFKDNFIVFEKQNTIMLKISVPYKFSVYINGKFAANGQFADAKNTKTYSLFDISAFVKKGENEIRIKTYYLETDFAQCYSTEPYIRYELQSGNEVLAYSSERTLCAKDNRYTPVAPITLQIGTGYDYSFVNEECCWQNAKEVFTNVEEKIKPIKNTYTTYKPCQMVGYGDYILNGGNTSGEIMQNAFLSSKKIPQEGIFCCEKNHDGAYLLGDLGQECAGYPHFVIECDNECEMYLGWGEHLADLRVRTAVGGRNFAVKITLKKGINDFSEFLVRIGARYLCLFVSGERKFTIKELGLYEETYPLKKPKKDFGDRLLNAIYETSRRTLELCMHEHYEDCPWREQALYGMDSRNQMLFGYTAFEEYAFPRAILRLIAESIGEDGFIPLCPPARNTITIPSFSLYWIIAIYENVKADFNQLFLGEILPYAERVIETFIKQTNNGITYTFGDIAYWNFHEWSDGLDGGEIMRTERIEQTGDACLTALTYMALKRLSELEKMVRNMDKRTYYERIAQEIAIGLESFYDKEKGLYSSYLTNGQYHEYTQALLLCAKIMKNGRAKAIIDKMRKKEGNLIPVTLSGLQMKYAGMLAYSNCLDYVIEDICCIFGKMLFNGATSFWETELGEKDFYFAGSLCHGWSAVACYVLDTYYKNKA